MHSEFCEAYGRTFEVRGLAMFRGWEVIKIFWIEPDTLNLNTIITLFNLVDRE